MKETVIKEIKDWLITFAIAFVCAFLVNKLALFIAVVPTGSMIPTINPAEKVLVTKTYNPENLDHGDIVVFTSEEIGKTLLKRLIAKPGDRLQVLNGVVTINGLVQDEPYVFNKDNASAFGGEEVTVPENGYFFLGDNRLESHDARYWANPFIDGDAIMGEARFRIFPLTRIGGLQ